MKEKLFEEERVKIAGTNSPCETLGYDLGFRFELKETKSFSFKPKEIQVEDQETKLVVIEGDKKDSLIIRWLPRDLIWEACEGALREIQKNKIPVTSPSAFVEVVERHVKGIFHEHLSNERVFPGKKGIKIKLQLLAWRWGGWDAPFEFRVRARIAGEKPYLDQKPFWEANFERDYLAAKRAFDLLVIFCEGVVKPSVRQIKNFAKRIVAKD